MRPPPGTDTRDRRRPLRLLVFELAGRRLALDAGRLIEVVQAVAIEPLPRSPRVVEGVVNYRGAVAPVLDLRHRLGLPPRPLDPDQHFVVTRTSRRTVVLRVDRAVELAEVAREDVESPLSVVPEAELVEGLARTSDGLLVIHDLERFLEAQEEIELEKSLGEAGMDENADPEVA